ncbi:MAG: four helix bundle protein [Bacteroidota bacterium]|nr:four helix bundle protein [Bacteroidota bacterium]
MEEEIRQEKSNIILDMTFNYALQVIAYTEQLESAKKYVIAKQLFRSGTSVGANVREAQYAESKVDFIHKLKIAEKEANETEYWLMLCKQSQNFPFEEKLLTDILAIKKVLSRIITTTKQSLSK